MSHKISISMAALGIAIAIASCGENEGPTSKQSGSTVPEPQQTPSTQPQEKRAKQDTPAEPQQVPPGQTVQPTSEQQKQAEASQQKQTPQVAGQEQPSTVQSQPTDQSGTAPARAETQPIQPQQNQAQAQPSQPQQPGEKQQATATLAAGPLNLTRDQILEAQRLLNQKGFDVGEIDGIIGPRTRRAVIVPATRGLGTERPNRRADRQHAWSLDRKHQRPERSSIVPSGSSSHSFTAM
jgi:hypothetical protein